MLIYHNHEFIYIRIIKEKHIHICKLRTIKHKFFFDYIYYI
jgi:hypothetical protein